MIGLEQLEKIEQAYFHFNHELFNDELPEVYITMRASGRTYGYHRGDSFERSINDSEGDGQPQVEKISELALNPEKFQDLPELLQTLVHEMAHVWQLVHGKPSRNGYHNMEWVRKMESVGLIPSKTGKKGGKKTGQQMMDYAEDGGQFDQMRSKLFADGWTMEWAGVPDGLRVQRETSRKVTYKCPICELTAYGKPHLSISCNNCSEVLLPQPPKRRAAKD